MLPDYELSPRERAIRKAEQRKTKWVDEQQWREQLSKSWENGNRSEQLQEDIGKVMSCLNIRGLEGNETKCRWLLEFTLGLNDKSEDKTALLRTVDSKHSVTPPATSVLGKLTRTLSDSFYGRELSLEYMTADNLVQTTLGIPNRNSANGDDGYKTAVERVGMFYKRAEAYRTCLEENEGTSEQPSTTAP